MKSEQNIEKYLCRRVKENGGMAIKLVGYTGIPDRLVIANNKDNIPKVYFVEMKTDGGRVAPVQLAVHLRLRKMGHDVRVIWDYDGVNNFINELFGGV